jgi:hypothetical protein
MRSKQTSNFPIYWLLYGLYSTRLPHRGGGRKFVPPPDGEDGEVSFPRLAAAEPVSLTLIRYPRPVRPHLLRVLAL